MNQMDKGAKTEEVLRRYFISLGYFVVRGIEISFQGDEVTDVDLYLYGRHTPLSRERINVDVKDKKRPKAMRRILWASGLREIFDVDKCIVATTDRRDSVVEFGDTHGVRILHGGFLEKLKASANLDDGRLGDEALVRQVSGAAAEAEEEWLPRVETAKERLIRQLDFDGCNRSLSDIEFFLERAVARPGDRQPALRCAFLLLSYFLVMLDYCLCEQLWRGKEAREEALKDGLRFGAGGRERLKEISRLASVATTAFIDDQEISEEEIQNTLWDGLDEGSITILTEFVAQNGRHNRLVSLAKEFEKSAYRVDFNGVSSLSGEGRSALAAIGDYFDIDRSELFER